MTIKSIDNTTVVLENGMKAYYDKTVGTIAVGDAVIVYGNVIIQKANHYENPS